MQQNTDLKLYCTLCFSSFDKYTRKPYNVCSRHFIICQDCLKRSQNHLICSTCQAGPIKITQVTVDYETLISLYPDLDPMEIQISDPFTAKLMNQLFDNKFKTAENELILDPGMVPVITPSNYIDNNNHVYPSNQQIIIRDNEPTQSRMGFCKCNEISSQRQALYLIVICVQFIFTFCNLYFATNNTQTQCMDVRYDLGILTLRSWLYGIGYTEIVLIVALLLNLFFYKITCLAEKTFQFLQVIIGVAFLIKILLWASIQFAMFGRKLAEHCSGGIFAYLVILTILHVLVGIIMTIATGCKFFV